MQKQYILLLLIRLWRQFDFHKKRQFIALLFLMVLTSFAELLSIGSIFPFLGALMNPESIYNSTNLQWIFSMLDINNPKEIIFPLASIFIISVIFACLLRLFQLKRSLEISFSAGADIGFRIYERTLYQPYSVHLSRNTSEIIDGITTKTTAVTDGIIMSSLHIISSLIMLGFLLFTLAIIAPFETAISFSLFGAFYATVMIFTKNRQIKNSYEISQQSTKVIRSLQEGLGGIREVLLDGTQEVYCKIYLKSDSLLRKAYASSSFISASPRIIIEGIGTIVIVVIAIYFSQLEGGISNAIPAIGVIALAAQRLLPIMQLSYGGWSNIRRNQHTLAEVLKLLTANNPAKIDANVVKEIAFSHNISLENISFKFPDNSNNAISNVSLTIKKGSIIGIIGTTGSGKTTLLDIVMGLLSPSSGTLKVDGVLIDRLNTKAWQKHISHVPQNIFLSDASIEENIAFGLSNELIDRDRVMVAASKAQLLEVIDRLPDGILTRVGERGIRLSGGQKQRIGIARALYKNVDLIILDEATSALDHITEQKIMESIDCLSPNVTVLIIAHRFSTLKNCTKIIQFEDGMIANILNYEDLLNKFTEDKNYSPFR